MRDFRIGPFRFQYLPDGDDPGVGIVRISIADVVQCEIQCSRDEWDEFAEEAGS